jgi:membrane-bound lytic murein transglycosylase B
MRFNKLFYGAIFVAVLLCPSVTLAELTPEQRAVLEVQLAQVEKEIAINKKFLDSKKQETQSISRDVDILNYKINQAKLNIKARQIEIQRLGGDINKKVEFIGILSDKIDEDKRSLTELLRTTRELDDVGISDVVFGDSTLTGFLSDVSSFQFIQESLQSGFQVMRGNQDTAAQEKLGLEKRRDAELTAKMEIEKEKKSIEVNEAEKKRLLKDSKSQEAAYQSVIANKEAERAKIKSALFQLRDSGQIKFGDAVQYATIVSKQTGVRPAFLLAILTQETNLGANVGTCNRAGDPPSKGYKAVMHPTRDQALFVKITQSLGLDPATQPVSCPYGGGYGGGMGPAQFIPSTWMQYAAQVAAVTGHNPASPWNTQDAFTASGIFLRDLGAGSQKYADERKAALRYYAGGNWANPKNAFYGNSVMAIATRYQGQINILNN